VKAGSRTPRSQRRDKAQQKHGSLGASRKKVAVQIKDAKSTAEPVLRYL
jgi:hypothetical protein